MAGYDYRWNVWMIIGEMYELDHSLEKARHVAKYMRQAISYL